MKSSSPWIVNDFNFGVPDSPRGRTHKIREGRTHEVREGQDVSPLHDLLFADMRLFPQAVVQWIQEHHDLCEHYGLFPEYSPQLGLRNIVVPTDGPVFIKLIYSLCHQQLSNQLEPDYLEV
jgi:hypothetical protein